MCRLCKFVFFLNYVVRILLCRIYSFRVLHSLLRMHVLLIKRYVLNVHDIWDHYVLVPAPSYTSCTVVDCCTHYSSKSYHAVERTVDVRVLYSNTPSRCVGIYGVVASCCYHPLMERRCRRNASRGRFFVIISACWSAVGIYWTFIFPSKTYFLKWWYFGLM